jgi:hypothetical protein
VPCRCTPSVIPVDSCKIAVYLVPNPALQDQCANPHISRIHEISGLAKSRTKIQFSLSIKHEYGSPSRSQAGCEHLVYLSAFHTALLSLQKNACPTLPARGRSPPAPRQGQSGWKRWPKHRRDARHANVPALPPTRFPYTLMPVPQSFSHDMDGK